MTTRRRLLHLPNVLTVLRSLTTFPLHDSKGKFLSCKLCGVCLSCGSKFPCDQSDSGHPEKGRLSSYDLVHLLRRRYEGSLVAAFGFSLVKTVSLKDLSDRTVGEWCPLLYENGDVLDVVGWSFRLG